MDGDDDGAVDGAPDAAATPPDRAFALLGDETRVAILRALHESPADVVPFSDLRERVGDPDSGRFNYHLGELAGHFVARREAGYELTQAGREVVRAVLAGSLTERPAVEPAPADADCPHCGGSLRVRYDGRGVVACADCGATVLWNEFPPAGLEDRTPAELARAVDRWTRGRFRLAMDGVCPSCARAVETHLPGRRDAEGTTEDSPAAVHRCPNCGYEARVPLFAYALFHPAAIALYHDAGVDVTDAPFWKLRALVGDGAATVEPGKPWTATVRLAAGGEALRMRLDGSLSVVDVEGVAVEGADVEGDDVEGVDVEEANVEEADVEGVDVERADVEGDDVEGDDVEGADVEEADVEGVAVEGDDVEEADVEGVAVERDDVEEADVEGVAVEGDDVEGTDAGDDPSER